MAYQLYHIKYQLINLEEMKMGEYAKRKSDGEKVKIGTCESMYYCRYEDKNKVIYDFGDYSYFWRLPFPDEDNITVGNYDPYNRGSQLTGFEDLELINDPGIMQVSSKSGLLLNVNCYHGYKLPTGSTDIKPFWNGKGNFFELNSIKNVDKKFRFVVTCKYCRHMWSYEPQEIIDNIVNSELKTRLKKYI